MVQITNVTDHTVWFNSQSLVPRAVRTERVVSEEVRQLAHAGLVVITEEGAAPAEPPFEVAQAQQAAVPLAAEDEAPAAPPDDEERPDRGRRRRTAENE